MKQKIAIIASVLMLAFSAAPDARAQWVLTNWSSDSNSGAICFAASGKNTSSSIFAATEMRGIFRSTDNGTSWTASSTGLPPQYYDFVNALAITDTNTATPILFAATGGGLFISTTTGVNWSQSSNGLTGIDIYSIVLKGENIFVGTDSGVFRSTDKGINWIEANAGLPNNLGALLEASDTNIYAITDSGLYLSTDNGTSWFLKNTSLFKYRITAYTTLGSSLYFGTDSGVFISNDNGASWNSANKGLPANSYVNAFAVSGKNIFASTYAGILLSTDLGSSWTDCGWNHSGWVSSGVYSLAVSRGDLFAGTLGPNNGVWRRPISEMINTSAVAETPLSQNSISAYPNPFSQSTTITFSSPESGAAEVAIVNLLGSEVKRLFSGEMDAGNHDFSWDASGLPPGMYECVVRMNGKAEEIPIVLEK